MLYFHLTKEKDLFYVQNVSLSHNFIYPAQDIISAVELHDSLYSELSMNYTNKELSYLDKMDVLQPLYYNEFIDSKMVLAGVKTFKLLEVSNYSENLYREYYKDRDYYAAQERELNLYIANNKYKSKILDKIAKSKSIKTKDLIGKISAKIDISKDVAYNFKHEVPALLDEVAKLTTDELVKLNVYAELVSRIFPKDCTDEEGKAL